MRRLLLTICYDGTNYCGWQVQPNAITVQEVLQKTLLSIVGDLPNGICGCSRTDSGVHANMFCCHFDTNSNIPLKGIVAALNARLPWDIAATDCVEVANDFHARYNCNGKNYIYKMYNSSIRNPFKEKYFYRYSRHIDVDMLNEGCKVFLGKHDFKGFCSSGSSVKDTIRTVNECSVTKNDDDIIFSITADGFLYNMVRIFVGTMIYVSEGKIRVNDLPDIINSCDRSRAGMTVVPHGLYLNKVFYDFNQPGGESVGCKV